MLAYTESGVPSYNAVQLLVGDKKRRGVAYVSVETQEGGLEPIGTAFFVDVPWGARGHIRYAVTARHCIEGQDRIYLEVTSTRGKYGRVECHRDQWFASADTDLACYRPTFDASYVTAIDVKWQFVRHHRFGIGLHCGMDVFIVGLFIKSPYRQNLDEVTVEPIVRFGKIALPSTEAAVYFDPREQDDPSKATLVSARLIESISFSGESGSPVFLYEEHTKDAPQTDSISQPVLGYQFAGPPRKITISDMDIHTPLLGMISSHWKIESEIRSRKRHKLAGDVGLNSGIAIVIPSEDIEEFLMNDPAIKKDREKVPKRLIGEPATPLAVKPKGQLGITKAAFEAALKKASRKIGPKTE